MDEHQRKRPDTVPLRVAAADLAGYRQPSWRELEYGLLSDILVDSEFVRAVDSKVAAETSRMVRRATANLWPTLDEPDPQLRRVRIRAALMPLIESEPDEGADDVRNYWVAMLLAKTLERYASDPSDALGAIDVLFAVLDYPETLAEFTTYGRDGGSESHDAKEHARRRVEAAETYLASFCIR